MHKHNNDSVLPALLSPAVNKKHSSRSMKVIRVGALLGCSLLATIVAYSYISDIPWTQSLRSQAHHNRPVCPQELSLSPTSHSDLLNQLDEYYASNEFTHAAAEWLGGAVRIPQVLSSKRLWLFSWIDGSTERKAIRADPQMTKTLAGECLDSSTGTWRLLSPKCTQFRKITTLSTLNLRGIACRHEHLKIIKINTYGLIYEWSGSDSGLKPILLTAHQGMWWQHFLCAWSFMTSPIDVVPVDPNTVLQWVHPPYSGHFDGMYSVSDRVSGFRTSANYRDLCMGSWK